MSGRARAIVGFQTRKARLREIPGGRVPVIHETTVPEWVATDDDPNEAALWWLDAAMRTELGISATVTTVTNTGPGRFTIEWED